MVRVASPRISAKDISKSTMVISRDMLRLQSPGSPEDRISKQLQKMSELASQATKDSTAVQLDRVGDRVITAYEVSQGSFVLRVVLDQNLRISSSARYRAELFRKSGACEIEVLRSIEETVGDAYGWADQAAFCRDLFSQVEARSKSSRHQKADANIFRRARFEDLAHSIYERETGGISPLQQEANWREYYYEFTKGM